MNETVRLYDIRSYSAPLDPRGYIRFVNLRPDIKYMHCWFCDACGARVPKSKQEKHARYHYLPKKG